MTSLAVCALSAACAGWLMVPARARLPSTRRAGDHWLGVLAAAGVAVLLVPAGWLVPAAILGCTCLGGRALWLRRVAARQAEVRAARLAEVCDLLAGELAAGRTPDAALAEAADVWPELRHAADTARLGGDVPSALRVAGRPAGC